MAMNVVLKNIFVYKIHNTENKDKHSKTNIKLYK